MVAGVVGVRCVCAVGQVKHMLGLADLAAIITAPHMLLSLRIPSGQHMLSAAPAPVLFVLLMVGLMVVLMVMLLLSWCCCSWW